MHRDVPASFEARNTTASAMSDGVPTSHRWNAGQAERWLRFLADHLTSLDRRTLGLVGGLAVVVPVAVVIIATVKLARLIIRPPQPHHAVIEREQFLHRPVRGMRRRVRRW
ncbi:hypothetical protein [Actinocrispum sp. NPDC049592]|uniref:hypothetical protein n=1 Tax=Actinocrispum sp. NPDC049592 TaxID=3154835 RepID=UPI0034128D81